MDAVILERKSRISIRIDETAAIGHGATAHIYPISSPGYADTLAKIYKNTAQINKPKLIAMLENPPATIYNNAGGVRHPQYAWPLDLLHSANGRLIGYAMPRIDETSSLTLDYFYDRHLSSNSKLKKWTLTHKLEIGRNLAGVLAELHRNHHCVIDLKPQNVCVFRDVHTVALLDCDSYRISGRMLDVFPATNFTSEYIAPEGLINAAGPAALSEGQDRFALAVILFQLLNNGIHPFQGIYVSGPELGSTDEKVRCGLYPYGVKPNPAIKPVATSVHGCFDEGTRQLFDRAFTASRSLDRPTASEWKDHFAALLNERRLERCPRYPSDSAHIRFAGMGCAACLYDSILEEVAQTAADVTGRSARSSSDSAGRAKSLTSTQVGTVVPPDPPPDPWWYAWLGGAVILAIAALTIWLISSAGSPANESSSGPAILRVSEKHQRAFVRSEPKLKPGNQLCCLAQGALVHETRDATYQSSRVADVERGVNFVHVEVKVPQGVIDGWISDQLLEATTAASTPVEACEDPRGPYCR
jgi:serine/threonine protein kinase